VLAASAPSPAVLAKRIRAALAGGDTEAAQATFVELLGNEAATDDVRRQGRTAFLDAKAATELRSAFETALAGSSPPAAAAGLYMEWLGLRHDWRGCDALLGRLPRQTAVRRAGLADYVRALRTAKERRRLARLAKAERTALRADDFLWGLAGHALSLFDDRSAVDWMQDWPEHRASPWALNALVVSLRRLRRPEEALRVSRRALQMPADHITPCHRAWVGIEAAIDGDLAEAESAVDGLEPPADSKAFYDALVLLARAAIAMRRSAGAAFDEARRLIKEADRLVGRSHRDTAPLRRRTVDLVVRERGGVAAWLWRFLDTS
jgi:tetratricopeptide (TPR) repeat protein